jgi:hypothetical protein
MKFSSNIPTEELKTIYTDSLAQLEKKLMLRTLELGQDPETFDYENLDTFESSLQEDDAESKDKVKVIRQIFPAIEMINKKLEELG